MLNTMNSASGNTQISFFTRAAYSVAFLLVILPMADIVLGLFPIQLGNIRWRVGVIGLTAGALLLPIVGLTVSTVVSHLRGHFKTQYFLAALNIVASLLLLAAMVLFALDTIQLRGEVNEAQRHLYDRAAVKGILAQLFTALVLGSIGIGSLTTSKASRRRAPVVKPTTEAPIIAPRV